MKKFFSVFTLLVVVAIFCLFFFSSAGSAIYAFLQRFFPSRESPSLVFIPVDDADIQNVGTASLSDEQTEAVLLLARELGAKSFFVDSNLRNPVVKIDELIKNEETSVEKQASLFHIKIVIPGRSVVSADSKTRELNSPFFKIHAREMTSFSETVYAAGNTERPARSRNLLVKKDGVYYADAGFASVLHFLDVQKLNVSDGAILLETTSAKMKIPRNRDGSLLLKYPKKSWKEYKSVSFSDLQNVVEQEKKFVSYLLLMEEYGFFGELNTENPLGVYRESQKLKSDGDKYRALKNTFYSLMSLYLSGRQEQILLDAVSDDVAVQTIKSMFGTCRVLFSDIETARAKLREMFADSLCICALTADSYADFTTSPFETHFPRSAESFVLANMMLTNDFFSPVMCVVSLLITIALLLLVIAAICLSIVHFIRKNKQKRALELNFSQSVPNSLFKKVLAKPSDFVLDGQTSDATVVAVSIFNEQMIETLLNGAQLLAFLNYYIAKVSAIVVQHGGIVESYRNDELIALFGAPVHSEKHCEEALACSVSLKDLDREINADIHMYPQSPKVDGMSDDLYTAFFILNHNGRKIMTRIGVYSGMVTGGCLGDAEKKAYRVSDDSWKKAIMIKDTARKFGNSGILINENAFQSVRDDYIIRKFGTIAESENETFLVSEVLGIRASDDEKLWNYAQFWNQAIDLQERGETEKALGIFKKLLEGRPNDKAATYFIKLINGVE